MAEIDKTLLEHDQALETIWQHLQPNQKKIVARSCEPGT